jgi:hypothetical protein
MGGSATDRPFTRTTQETTPMRTLTVTARSLALLLLTTSFAFALTAAGGSASAGDSSWVRGINSVLYQGCHEHPYQYHINADQASYDWSLQVTAYDPRGIEATSSWIWKDEGDPPSGTAGGDNALSICSGERPGRYTIRAELNFYGGPYTDQILPESSFTLRLPRTRTSLKVNDRSAALGQRLRFKIRSKTEFPTGYFGSEYERVVLERKAGARWLRMGRRYTTNSRGVAVAKVSWDSRRPVKVRAVTRRTEDHGKSTSRPVNIT